MNIPKCPKTVSGKHMWDCSNGGYMKPAHETTVLDVTMHYPAMWINAKCMACGMVDDTHNPILPKTQGTFEAKK